MNKYNYSNKFFKIMKIILINILLIILIWFLFNVCFFIYSLQQEKNLTIERLKTFNRNNFRETLCIDNSFSLSNLPNKPHNPVGLKYNKSPLLILGCSFAYGQYLNDKQIFSSKLSEINKQPVYNRALPGYGLQHAYYQTTQEYFYNQVPPCNTVVYVFIDDHFRRMLGEEFYITYFAMYLHYTYKDDKFILDNYDNPFFLFYKNDYIFKTIRKLYNQFYLKNNPDKITDEALAYFIKIRENLENHWHKKINFIVLFYEDSFNSQYTFLKKSLIPKLESNNFEVIETSKLTDESLFEGKYLAPENDHPTEQAWELITPLFVEECKKRKILL